MRSSLRNQNEQIERITYTQTGTCRTKYLNLFTLPDLPLLKGLTKESIAAILAGESDAEESARGLAGEAVSEAEEESPAGPRKPVFV